MVFFDLSNPILAICALVVAMVLIGVARYTRKSIFASINLFLFLALIIIHVMQFMTATSEMHRNLFISLGFDFVFILLTFISYLWIDDMEAKEKDKKSVDNSLDWFWDKL